MSVRPHPTKGDGWWVIDYYPSGRKGKRVVFTFKGTKGAALAMEQDMRRGPGEVKNRVSPLIRDLVSPWLEHYKTVARPLTHKDAVNSLAHLLPRFGMYKPANITRQTIADYKMARLQEAANPGAVAKGKAPRPPSKRTISKELSYLSSLLRWAAEMDLCPELPFTIRGFPSKQTRAEVVRPLTPRQITAILENVDPKYRLLYLLWADMGLRRNEGLAVTAEDVDEYRETLSVVGKGAKQRIIPWLSNRFADELRRELDKRPSGPLVVNEDTGEEFSETVKWLKRAARKAEIRQNVHPHLLRHSCLSNLAMAGMSPHALQQIAGHSSIETTNKIYVHIRSDFVAAEAERIRKKG